MLPAMLRTMMAVAIESLTFVAVEVAMAADDAACWCLCADRQRQHTEL